MSNFPDSAVLFPNDRKQRDQQPDYTGKGEWQGSQFELSAWVNTSKSGKRYLSIKLSPPYVAQQAQQAPQAQEPFLDDDLPF